MQGHDKVECDSHGAATATYICRHLVEGKGLGWYCDRPSPEQPWPDAWCDACHRAYLAEGEWNEKSEAAADIGNNLRLICHHCYEALQGRHRLRPL